MTITLEAIEAKHTEVGEMIAAFKKQPVSTEYMIGEATIRLNSGERYAGLLLGDDGMPSHHLILLPGDVSENWKDAGKWAQKQGGSLPTRREQSLLFANLKGEFQSSYYWSSEEHESESGWAWYQLFFNGYQSTISKSISLRARAVRRLVIQ